MTPQQKRLLNFVRRTFKIVKFRHSLTIADKKITLSAKGLGFQTEDIDHQLKTSFRLMTDEDRNEINRILKQLDKFIQDSIKEGWIKSLHPYGYVVSYQDPSVFTIKISMLKKKISSEIVDLFTEKYTDIKRRSTEKIKVFLHDDVFPRVRPVRAQKHSRMTDKQFREDWVNEYAKIFEFPECEDIIKSLKIGYDLFDISKELLENPDFRERLESEFEVNLDQLLEKEES